MYTMSHTESFCTITQPIGNRGVGVRERTEDGRADKDTTFVRSDSASLERNVRERVLKEVGLTSTTFIGPAFPPKTTTVKADIEDTLSEFYKELEKIDRPDGANDNPGKQDAGFVQPPIPAKLYASKETQGVSKEKSINKRKAAETDCYQDSSEQKHPSWPHWYQNEPYYPRMPRPGMDRICVRAAPTQSHWRHPQTLKGPPNPRFHRPPFHCRPTPSAFPNPQNPPSHINQNWSGSGFTIRIQEELNFPKSCSFPPPNVCSPTSQDFYGDSPYLFDRDERGCSNDVNSDHVNAGWPTDRKEELCQLGEDYDTWQRYDSEDELWDHHCQPGNNNAYNSPLVLILMRGLPGSGKSTRARELLSTGPSGLILSTDDYFVHRDGYHYELGRLGAAHEWNQSRAKDAMRDGRSPIIIDNTNTQAWEMKPYVQMALERGYKVDFCEPDTSWKFDPYELEKKNKHGVPQEKIAQMMDRFSFPISIDIIMNSQEPLHVNQRRRPEQPQIMQTRDFY